MQIWVGIMMQHADMSRVLFRINNAKMSEVLFQFWNNNENTSQILVPV